MYLQSKWSESEGDEGVCKEFVFTLRLPSLRWESHWRDLNRHNLSGYKEISPGFSLEGLMLKLKLQCFGHLMQRANSFEKTLMLGKIEGRRRRG